jgi:hypothetical protein
MFASLFAILALSGANAWEGILLDGRISDTQLFTPPTSDRNVYFGQPHLSASAAVMLNGLAYFIGGATVSDDTVTPQDTVTIFDPATNTSHTGSSLITARYWHAAAIINGTIIVCGGVDTDKNVLDSCEQFLPVLQLWTIAMPMPEAKYSFSMATLSDGVYVFGGTNASLKCGSSDAYQFDGTKWWTARRMPYAPYAHASVAISDNLALVCGGVTLKSDNNCYAESVCYFYSASDNSWTSAPPMAMARYAHSMVVFQCK